MVDALTALYQKETGKTVDKAFGGNIGQMLPQVKEGGKVNVVISDDATLRRFDALLSAETTRRGARREGRGLRPCGRRLAQGYWS